MEEQELSQDNFPVINNRKYLWRFVFWVIIALAFAFICTKNYYILIPCSVMIVIIGYIIYRRYPKNRIKNLFENYPFIIYLIGLVLNFGLAINSPDNHDRYLINLTAICLVMASLHQYAKKRWGNHENYKKIADRLPGPLFITVMSWAQSGDPFYIYAGISMATIFALFKIYGAQIKEFFSHIME